MAALPSQVTYGRIRGTILRAVIDSADADVNPDSNPATGTITFTPQVSGVIAYTGLSKTVVIADPIVVTLDGSGAFDIYLVATDTGNPVNWTYKVDIAIPNVTIPSFNIAVTTGSDTGIDALLPVGISNGVLTVRGPQGDSGTGGSGGAVTSVNTKTGDVVLVASDVGAASASSLTAHTGNTSNPHSTTKAQVGLGNVDNTSDVNKPVSTAQSTALAAKADLVNSLVPTSQIPAVALTTGQTAANRAAMLALSNVQPGDMVAITAGADKGTYILTGTDPSVFANWLLLNAPTDVVQSVNGQNGTVVLGYSDVGAASASQGTKADGALAQASNLSDLTSAGTARTNLGLGNAATKAVGTTAGTVAAGDDSRFSSGGGGSFANGAASPGADVAVAQTTVTDICQVTLPVGTHIVSCTATILGGANNLNADVFVVAGTATATIGGVAATTSRVNSNVYASLSLDVQVTVTVAGTVVFRAYGDKALTVKVASGTFGVSPASGLVWRQVA